MTMLRKEKYFSPQALDRIKQKVRAQLPHHPRNACMILTAIYTGARASEVVNIRVEDLNPDQSSIFIRGLKNSYDREPMVPRWLMDVLVTLPPTKKGTLFGIGYHRFQRIWKQYGSREKGLHALRHSLAIEICTREKDPRLVQYVLGHKSFQNTEIYMRHVWSTGQLLKALPPEDR